MDKPNAAPLLERFKSLHILVVGDLMVDAYLWGKVSRISPEAPIPVVEVTREESKPGGAANVGLNLLSLGAKVHFAGVVGEDEHGVELTRHLHQLGADCSAVVQDPGRPTTVKTRVIAHHQQVVRIDRENATPISSDAATRLLRHIATVLPKVDGVILSDYGKGVLAPDFCAELIRMAAGKIVTVDPKPQNIANFAGAGLITPNKHEAELASGIALRSEADVEAAARRLRDKHSLRHVLITRGEEGMSLLSDDRFLHLPTKARQVFDVTGAGDTVIAVATLALCAGAPAADAAQLSNIAAGITVAHVGVHAVTPDELMEAIGG